MMKIEAKTNHELTLICTKIYKVKAKGFLSAQH